MARARTITYECEQCGSDIIVTSTGEGQLSPIYCCGVQVTEITTAATSSARQKKQKTKTASVKKKTVKKSGLAKKKTAKT